jgi:hypothetical protein
MEEEIILALAIPFCLVVYVFIVTLRTKKNKSFTIFEVFIIINKLFKNKNYEIN